MLLFQTVPQHCSLVDFSQHYSWGPVTLWEPHVTVPPSIASVLCFRLHDLRPCDGGPSPEPGRLLLLQHWKSLPLHRSRRLRSQVQPHQQGVWLPGRRSLSALQIQDPGKMRWNHKDNTFGSVDPKEVEVMSYFCVCVVLQDKAQPETQASAFGDVAFKATLAQDTPGGLPLVRQPGSDGFSLSSSPLFQVCLYSFFHTLDSCIVSTRTVHR